MKTVKDLRSALSGIDGSTPLFVEGKVNFNFQVVPVEFTPMPGMSPVRVNVLYITGSDEQSPVQRQERPATPPEEIPAGASNVVMAPTLEGEQLSEEDAAALRGE